MFSVKIKGSDMFLFVGRNSETRKDAERTFLKKYPEYTKTEHGYTGPLGSNDVVIFEHENYIED